MLDTSTVLIWGINLIGLTGKPSLPILALNLRELPLIWVLLDEEFSISCKASSLGLFTLVFVELFIQVESLSHV